MKTVAREFVEQLIDFAPSEMQREKGFAHAQMEGTVALYNMLAQNKCAYLADEVGMGKTYIALGVMSLLRYFNPHARIIVIAPRENIQRKWVKELQNFVRLNWKIVGNRVKSLQGGPTWEPVVAGSLLDFAHETLLNADRDFFLRMTSFSIGLKDPKTRKRLRARFLKEVSWMKTRSLPIRTSEGFRDAFGCAFNAAVPDADLVIVDEAHNLKHGFGERVSTRNRVLGLSFGRPVEMASELDWYQPRAKRLLLLSATPFEEDYAAIQHQFDIFGFGQARLKDAGGLDPLPMSMLINPEVDENQKRDVVGRLLLRRVSGLRIAEQLYTKNMYRREWRKGGYQTHDEPMAIKDPKQRLVVALMQKKVAEVLQNERFNNQFQIGMLSSFESFLQTAKTASRHKKEANHVLEEEQDSSAFDGEDQVRRASNEERQGIDTEVIRDLVESYRQRFGHGLPHPKLDTTATALESAFETGEKTLVFVRRIATVDELGAKLDEAFDHWIRRRMESALPDLKQDIQKLFKRYARERSRRPGDLLEVLPVDTHDLEHQDSLERRSIYEEADEGSAETFFAWFFRGMGPKRVLSGAAFQKNRLASVSAVYATLFEDDWVSWLLGRPEDSLVDLAGHIDTSVDELIQTLRKQAYGYFRAHTQREKGYPRLYVFEAYQVAALELLAEQCDELGERAGIVLAERFPEPSPISEEPPSGFPGPENGIGLTTFFTELVKKPKLRAQLWPLEPDNDFREQFRRREQRRELLSAMARLGAAYIDLYLIAIKQLGSFDLGPQTEEDSPGEDLASAFVACLEKQQEEPGFHALRELSNAADAFDLLLSVNFPEVPNARLWEISRIYGATLQRQVPVGRMAGGVNKRLVRQFRMPGFPLVLVTTDVLQEGEDLHTFCRRVSHYGISWTPSAMEQRTGRVDRIGGLMQRRLDGQKKEPTPDELIQVYYPHLSDTVEVLQIKRVLRRLNRFLRLIHRTGDYKDNESSTIDTAQAILEEKEYIQPLEGVLESAFPVKEEWLEGAVGKDDSTLPDPEPCLRHLELVWQQLQGRMSTLQTQRTGQERLRVGSLRLTDAELACLQDSASEKIMEQRFQLELRSQTVGERTLLRCNSEVGVRNLKDDDELDRLYDLQRSLGRIKLCTRPKGKYGHEEVSIEGDILFHPETTQIDEVAMLVRRVTCAAAGLRYALSGQGQ